MFNRYPLNLSGRALWVRSATALATAAALAVAPAYGYQQFGVVTGDARVTVSLLTVNRTQAATALGLATAGGSIAPTFLAAGSCTAQGTATGIARLRSALWGTTTATATAYGSAVFGNAIGDVYCVARPVVATPSGGLNTPSGTLNGPAGSYETWIGGAGAMAYAAAARGQFLTATVLAEATGDAAGDITRYATLTDNLASIQYTRAETTLARAEDNPWNDGGSWDDGWQWFDTTVWRHEGFVPRADASVTVLFDDSLTTIIATIGPYNLGQCFVPAMTATLRQPGTVAAQGLANGTVAPTHTLKASASDSAAATAVVTGTRLVPTAAATGLAEAEAWVAGRRRRVATALGDVGEAVSGLVVGDHQQAGRATGTATSSLLLAQPGNQSFETSLDTGQGTLTPPLANLNQAARVNVSGVASAVGLEAKWSHGYLATAAALTRNIGSADADVDYQATASRTSGSLGTAAALMDYQGGVDLPATATGLATPATQHYALLDGAAGAYGVGYPATQHYALLDGAATATGVSSATMNYRGWAPTFWLPQPALYSGGGLNLPSGTLNGVAGTYNTFTPSAALAAATGTALAFANSDVLAPDCRYLRVLAEPRTILVPAEDRLLRVTC